MAEVSEMGLNSLLFSVSSVCITILYLLKLRKSCDGGSYTRCTFLKTPQDVLKLFLKFCLFQVAMKFLACKSEYCFSSM